MQIGDFFDGRYTIEKILGRGGMGIVYLARNINTDTFWAIKEICRKEDAAVDLLAEPRLLKKLEHPALPRLFDILEKDGKLYMISDYIEGVSLDKKIRAEGKISEELVADWAVQLGKALMYLHSQQPNPIIYRDMKPSNIILTGNGNLKLIDFGIAREYKSKSEADTVYIGTRGYAAPEQYGTGQTSAASDIYSLGVTLHHLLTGKSPVEPPFGIKPIRYYDSTLSLKMEEIICKCTMESAADRYQYVSELLDDLEKLLGNQCYEQGKYALYNAYPAGRVHDGVPAAAQGAVSRAIPGAASGYRASFSKLVITVWDNAEFGCELAYAAARFTHGEVLLADLDLLAPKADLTLSLKRYSPKLAQLGIFGHSGLDLIMDALEKNSLTAELMQQATIEEKHLKNLHVLTGNYRLENYEYYSADSIPKFIDKCYRSYDVTILLVNRSIYDAFTLAALLKSDMNITAVRGDVDKLREFNTYIAFLKDKQHLPPETTKFVLFEYDKSCSMPINEATEATQGNLLGKISASKKRCAYRNLKGAYAAHMEKEIASEYVHLLTVMGLLPALGMMQKAGLLLKRIFGSRSPARENAAEMAEGS